ncbi:WD40 repeat-like protein [Exidia glandulosa HHB12029]|uniref:WD40 repeat-like protein n=1 Tax=Exidia glandulosa HHB12029 TaxID=1314781 RepID=A0A165F767_EXIGL|nr:WD40 repeat-like protein [Exidia glandulosa HHB12029]
MEVNSTALGEPISIDKSLRSVAWFSDGKRVVVGCGDATIRILDVATAATLLRFIGHTGDVRRVLVSPNQKVLASCSHKTIKLWDAEPGLAIGAPMTGHTKPGHTGLVWSVAFSPDGQHIVSGDDTIRIWSTETCTTVLGPLYGHTNFVLSVAYSPDYSRIVSGSLDKTIQVWDAHTGNRIRTLRGNTDIVQSVAYSPDSLHIPATFGSCQYWPLVLIVSGSWDRTVRIWDATTGQLVGSPFEGHTNWVFQNYLSVAYSPDGTRIVSGSEDRTIRIWDAATGASIATIRGHTSAVLSVAFSPDEKRLASASGDGTVRTWDATDDWRSWDI